MQAFQRDIVNQLSVSLTSISEFPAYYNFSMGMGYELDSTLVVGFTFKYMSTGARSDYSDYSGSARVDQLLHAVSAGPFIRKTVNKSRTWPVALGLDLTAAWTTSSVKSSLTIQGAGSSSETLVLAGRSVGALGSVRINRYLAQNVSIYCRLGYEAFINSKLQFEGNDTDLHADWSGFRIGFGVSYSFNQVTPK
jgi:hypothetical protein